jgi:hypothetical protein
MLGTALGVLPLLLLPLLLVVVAFVAVLLLLLLVVLAGVLLLVREKMAAFSGTSGATRYNQYPKAMRSVCTAAATPTRLQYTSVGHQQVPFARNAIAKPAATCSRRHPTLAPAHGTISLCVYLITLHGNWSGFLQLGGQHAASLPSSCCRRWVPVSYRAWCTCTAQQEALVGEAFMSMA